MNKLQALEASLLYKRCEPSQFTFETTAELDNVSEIIGQARAVDAIRFGISIDHDGFNLFALGPNGIGKNSAVNQFLTQRAPNDPTPDDWCYVNNFEQHHKPTVLRLPPGQGSKFSQDMAKRVADLFTVIPATLNSDEFNTQKKAILTELKERQSQTFKALESEAREQKIAIINTPAGFAFAPIKDKEVISPDEFMKLPVEEQVAIEARITEFQDRLQQFLQQIPEMHRETRNKLNALESEMAGLAITPIFNELEQTYQSLPEVLVHLEAVKKDIVENVHIFTESEQESLARLVGIASSGSPQKAIETRYQVNMIVDNSRTNGAPIVFEDLPTYQNLIGRIEHVSQMGTLLTDFSLIKAGALHRANGGYLVLDARNLLLQPYAWEGLKRVLRAKKIQIESLGQIFSYISTVSLEPEPIPLKVKVILTGERMLYYLLSAHDPDFRELFKVAADFESEMLRDETNNQAYARLIADLARKEKLRHFNREAVARVIEHASRLTSDAKKLTTHMQSISDLLREANYWAGEVGHEFVTIGDVQQALNDQIYRSSRIQERIQESILRNTILIDTEGMVTGQVNGLSVIILDNYAFGHPSRITARIRLGKGEVVDIERQVELGGPIHSKGVMILAGFLGGRYAEERPLSLSATLVFEQSYGGVEGDSASSAELYALLSGLAEAPVHQSLAVTGSVNQLGQIQAIGGVNEKIEGFYDICAGRGLTGKQGVLIPLANVDNLMLRHDVVEAAEAGQFHIYPVSTIDEGIELLTGIPAGELDEDGNYPEESINGRIVARLTSLAEKAREYGGREFSTLPAGNGHVAAGEEV